MADVSRIDELRRRVRQDPASISFAALAEEYRRAGQFQEAIDVCREGLRHHPGYLSARVTLGRALLEIGELQDAHGELEHVLTIAPENLVATRTLEEIRRRRDLQATPQSFSRQQPVKVAPPDIPRTAVSQPPPDIGIGVPTQPSDSEVPAAQMVEATTADAPPVTASDADHTHATADEPALAGLEAFLAAILRARREGDHTHEQRR